MLQKFVLISTYVERLNFLLIAKLKKLSHNTQYENCIDAHVERGKICIDACFITSDYVHAEKVVSESVDNFEPAEAGETIVEGSLKPNVKEEVIVSTTSDDSATTNSCDSPSSESVYDSGKLGKTTYTSLENGDNKNQNILGNGHSNDDISDNANEIDGELKAKEEDLPAIQNEEEVKVEVKETSIFSGKWKQAAILPEESIEAWDEKREIVNVVTPIVDDNHPLPIKSEGELENGIDASTEKGAIESTIDESESRTAPNHKEVCLPLLDNVYLNCMMWFIERNTFVYMFILGTQCCSCLLPEILVVYLNG